MPIIQRPFSNVSTILCLFFSCRTSNSATFEAASSEPSQSSSDSNLRRVRRVPLGHQALPPTPCGHGDDDLPLASTDLNPRRRIQRSRRRFVSLRDNHSRRLYAPLCIGDIPGSEGSSTFKIDIRRVQICKEGSCFDDISQACSFDCSSEQRHFLRRALKDQTEVDEQYFIHHFRLVFWNAPKEFQFTEDIKSRISLLVLVTLNSKFIDKEWDVAGVTIPDENNERSDGDHRRNRPHTGELSLDCEIILRCVVCDSDEETQPEQSSIIMSAMKKASVEISTYLKSLDDGEIFINLSEVSVEKFHFEELENAEEATSPNGHLTSSPTESPGDDGGYQEKFNDYADGYQDKFNDYADSFVGAVDVAVDVALDVAVDEEEGRPLWLLIVFVSMSFLLCINCCYLCYSCCHTRGFRDMVEYDDLDKVPTDIDKDDGDDTHTTHRGSMCSELSGMSLSCRNPCAKPPKLDGNNLTSISETPTKNHPSKVKQSHSSKLDSSDRNKLDSSSKKQSAPRKSSMKHSSHLDSSNPSKKTSGKRGSTYKMPSQMSIRNRPKAKSGRKRGATFMPPPQVST